ncbi:MAG TPA: DNA mismatch repair endonuclease MutL [Pirellulaceae bacterium]|nr:DNA mismatch repair endonuclease MutL [Pirellulaceae bacterium]
MPQIRRLPTSIINKIAAGEVIERPASVVKELVENSVDAGAMRIDVAIENGGVDLIRVSDDGCGIEADQLTLAVTSHATSKIVEADDLFRIATMGFRGEALASIAEISRTSLRSRPEGADSGHELVVSGGEPEPIVPCGAPRGTTIEVRHLFFNTPVRRKYLKSPQTEMGHIAEAFTRVALAHPRIRFTLSHNGRTVHDLVPTEHWAERIGHFFGPEIRQALIPVSAADETAGISIRGFVVDPSQSRSHNRMQYLFLNGRHIRDRSLQHALSEAYRGLLMTGRFPIAFLQLDMPVEAVDVNVHPAKLEVRFQDGGRIYSHLLAAIRNRFLSTDLTARARLGKPQDETPRQELPTASETAPVARLSQEDDDAWRRAPSPALPFPIERAAPLPPFRAGSGDAFRVGGETERPLVGRATAPDFGSATPRSPFDFLPDLPRVVARPSSELSESRSYGTPSVDESMSERVDAGAAAIERSPADSPDRSLDSESIPGADGRRDRIDSEHRAPSPAGLRRASAVQIHHRYVVSECDEGLLVIDQHALHERILYEQFRERVLAGALETQVLLVPIPVTLPPTEAAAVVAQAETLARIGLQVEPFGGNAVLLRSYPAMMAGSDPEEVLRIAVDHLVGDGHAPERRDLVDELLHMMSCKAAVKAGDPLSPEELEALIEHRDLCQDAHHCPHGRPTALVFSRDELDRRFKRI